MKLSLHTALNVVQPEFYSGWEGWLNGPCGDAQSLAAELALADFSTQALINDAATVEAYSNALGELAGRTHPGDLVFLHHSHHGGRRDNGLFGGGHQETFCLSDGELLDTNWLDLLAQFPAGVNVVALLDCCHSGGMDRAGGRSKVRPRFIQPRLRAYPMLNGPRPLRCNLVILPACHASENCQDVMIEELSEFRGAWTWAFSRHLIRQRDIEGRVTVAEAYGTAAVWAAQHYPQQHPRVIRMGTSPELAWEARLT